MRTVIILVFLAYSLYADAQQNLFVDAQQKAKAENKNILLYFSGSDWCAPCIKFRKNFIDDPAFRSVSDVNLIIHNADFPRKKAHQLSGPKKADNENLAEAYNPSGHFPMILLLDPSGKIIKKWEGYPTVTLDEFLSQIQ